MAGLAAAFGSGAMTNPIADIEKADVILIIGSNTTENHPVLSSYVKRAVTSGNSKLIVVDPRGIKMTKFADTWLRPKLGTDVLTINGMMNVIINEDLYDKAYVEERTNGFEELKKTLEKYTPEYVEEMTGIPAENLITAAREYAGAKAGSILYCMGITQHTTGTDNVKSLANLAMLCGNLGIPGGGVNPLRGQNNVQGACDMGGLPNVFPAYKPVTDETTRKIFEEAWEVEGLPDKPGYTVTEMLPLANEGKIKSLYIIGENPLVSDPDLNHAKHCIDNLDFLVVQDIFLTETAQIADVVLPSACFAEKDGTFSNTERKVQRVRKAVNPPGEAKHDWQITCEIATRMGYSMSYDSSKAIFKEIARVTPSYAGITYERIENDGLHWPCPNENHPGTPILHIGQFTCGKGNFHAIDYIAPAEEVDEEYPMYLTTGRVLYHYHTGTMTMKSDGLNERAPECFVDISATDAGNYGIDNGAIIKVASRRGEIQAKANISDIVAAGTIFIPFHYAKAAANMLTNAALDPVAKIPEFKVCAVKLSASA
ncbi:Formate dehydrogenase subunit alpha [Candidatus Magnetomoraceae bacterium gMMP-15]